MRRRMLFITGPGCGLCAAAWRRLRPVRLIASIVQVDATTDPEAAPWLERIPVLLAGDGSVVWEQHDGGSPVPAALRHAISGR